MLDTEAGLLNVRNLKIGTKVIILGKRQLKILSEAVGRRYMAVLKPPLATFIGLYILI